MLISIIVPIYNMESTLERCVKSILQQTHNDIELILIDDGSIDRSGEICRSIASSDTRVKVISQPNGGTGVARNSGVRAASGDYIGFVDADDYIDPQMYERLLNTALNTGADVVQCGWIKINEYGSEIGKHVPTAERVITSNLDCAKFQAYDIDHTVVLWDKLYKRKVFNDIDFTKDFYSEDTYITTQIFGSIEKVYIIRDTLYFVMPIYKPLANDNETIKRLDSFNTFKNIYNYYAKRFPDLVPFAAANVCFCLVYAYCASRCIGISNDFRYGMINSFREFYSRREINLLRKNHILTTKKSYLLHCFRINVNLCVFIFKHIIIHRKGGKLYLGNPN